MELRNYPLTIRDLAFLWRRKRPSALHGARGDLSGVFLLAA
jgi:hypothetical protein